MVDFWPFLASNHSSIHHSIRLFHIDLVLFCFSSCCNVLCHCLSTTFCFPSSYAIFFSFLWAIQTGKSIFSKTKATNQIMIINKLKNWNLSYSSHYNIIKFVGI